MASIPQFPPLLVCAAAHFWGLLAGDGKGGAGAVGGDVAHPGLGNQHPVEPGQGGQGGEILHPVQAAEGEGLQPGTARQGRQVGGGAVKYVQVAQAGQVFRPLQPRQAAVYAQIDDRAAGQDGEILQPRVPQLQHRQVVQPGGGLQGLRRR